MTIKRRADPWTMPAWMERYRKLICNTGGNSVEELVNDHEATVANNVVRAALCVAVKSQVSLLDSLHKSGALDMLGERCKMCDRPLTIDWLPCSR